jgi:hypothetical protein
VGDLPGRSAQTSFGSPTERDVVRRHWLSA